MSASKAADAPTQPSVDLLEEDDEFEEFPAEEWGQDKEDRQDAKEWEDDWDDDNVEDDFSKQLRAELEKVATNPQPMKI